ncbi:MAG: zinc-ribbon domain-containing protein [Promethearchaeia archaeon]
MSETDIIFECKNCGWAFSLQRNEKCPMCDATPEFDKKFIRETLREYARRKGIYLKKRTCKKLVNEFEENYGRLPSFKEIWTIANKAVEQVKEGGEISLDVIQEKVQKVKKKQRKKQQRKKQLAEKRGVSKTKKKDLKCPECGHENPADSKFCLECGHELK